MELVADSNIAVTVKDAGGYCVYANKAAEEIRGFGPDEMVGKHITELAGSDTTLVEREFERFKRLLDGRNFRQLVGDVRRHAGHDHRAYFGTLHVPGAGQQPRRALRHRCRS